MKFRNSSPLARATPADGLLDIVRRCIVALRSADLARLLSSPAIGLAVVLALGAPVMMSLPVSHDVVWQMWVADQVDHGARLYTDIVEVNPPLWFWMGLAAHDLAAPFGIDPLDLLRLQIWLWAGFAAYAVGLLMPELTAPRRAALVAFAFAVCTVLPLHNYGQREHLVLLGALPYAFLLAARVRGLHPDAKLAAAVGVAAAFGFALKHYFVLAPLLGEAWLFLRLRKDYRPLRTETAMLLVSGLLYAAAVALWALPFLTTIVPIVRLAYGGFEVPFLEQVNEIEQLVWLLAAFCFARAGLPRDPARRRLTEVLLLFAAVFVLAYFAQQKGWQYHAIPATGMAVIALFVAMVLPASTDRAQRPWLAALACSLPLLFGTFQGPYTNVNEKHFAAIERGMKPGSGFFAIITNPSWAWPMTVERGHPWPSRYFSFWMLPTIGESEGMGRTDPALRRLGEQVVRNTVEDMRCHPPERLLIQVTPSNPRLFAAGFRMHEFFGRDPQFAALMRNYRLIRAVPAYELYEQVHPYGPQDGDRCRIVV